MKYIKSLLPLVMFACITSVSFAQDQPDIKKTIGERTYSDLKPASVTEVITGMRTYQTWTDNPSSGNYFYAVSTQESIFSLMQNIMDSLTQKKEQLQDYAFVMEYAPLNDIFITELMYSYKNSTRIKNEIKSEEDAIQKAHDDILAAKTAKDHKGALRRQAKKDLKSALQKQIDGNARRKVEFAEALNLLYKMKDQGFGYLKGVALVKIKDIITDHLPNRQYDTKYNSQQNSPQTFNNSGQNSSPYTPQNQYQSSNQTQNTPKKHYGNIPPH